MNVVVYCCEFRMTPGCYTFKFEYEKFNVTVALANSEPMDIIQIESLAKPPHKDRRELATHLILLLQPGLSEYIQFQNLSLPDNAFINALKDENWDEALCTLTYADDTEILLWIHRTVTIYIFFLES